MNSLMEHLQTQYLIPLQVVWPALVAATALAVAGGVVGVFVVLRRETLVVLAMPQIVMLGAAVGLRYNWPALPPAIGAVAVALGFIGWFRQRDRGDLILPALYVAGLCLAILVVSNAGAHLSEVQSLFSGIDVAVGADEAAIAAGVLLTVAGLCALLWRRWLLLAQAPAAAQLAGLRPTRWNALFLILLSVVLVVATNAVGTVMVVALLFLPAATVLPWAKGLPGAMIAAATVGVMCVAGGFALSVEMGWPLSHSVGGAGFGIFLLFHAADRLRHR
jgi:ABC-type Mn2+/Zn2+ transport system permease subunit